MKPNPIHITPEASAIASTSIRSIKGRLRARLTALLVPCVLATAGQQAFAADVIKTDMGAGADTYVRGGSFADTNYNSDPNNQVWVQSDATLDGSRKGYLRFDLSSLTGPVEQISLKLNVRIDNAVRVNVYGLSDGAAGDAAGAWTETGVTWNNAPGNNLTSSNGVTAAATLLGTFDMVDTTDNSSGPYIFSSDALRDFINADTNGLVTIILTGSASIGGDGGLSVGFRTKEQSTDVAPQLVIGAASASIQTNVGAGADVFVGGGAHASTNFNNDPNGQIWVEAGSTTDFWRKGYIRFDRSSVSGQINVAHLVLSIRIDNAVRIHVYGLRDGITADKAPGSGGWSEGGITWNNAPANNTTSKDGFTADATLLGTFDVTDTSNNSSGPYVFSTENNPAFLDFLNKDTNGLVTIMLAGSASIGGDGGLSVGFRTKEFSIDLAPELILNPSGKCTEPYPPGINLADKGLKEGDVINGYLSTYVANDTTVIIPPGTYVFNANLTLDKINYTVIAPRGAVFKISGLRTLFLRGSGWRFSGIVFDQRGTSTRLVLNNGGNNWKLDNCSWEGVHEGGEFLMVPFVTSTGATGVVEKVYMGDGQVAETDGGGVWVNANAGHYGTLTFRQCNVAHFCDNGIYGTGPPTKGQPGVTNIDSCFFHANTISNARNGALNGKISYVKNSKFLLDCTNPRTSPKHNSSKTTRAVWVWYGHTVVQNCDFKIDCGHGILTHSGGTFEEINNRYGAAADMSVPAGVPTSARAVLCW